MNLFWRESKLGRSLMLERAAVDQGGIPANTKCNVSVTGPKTRRDQYYRALCDRPRRDKFQKITRPSEDHPLQLVLSCTSCSRLPAALSHDGRLGRRGYPWGQSDAKAPREYVTNFVTCDTMDWVGILLTSENAVTTLWLNSGMGLPKKVVEVWSAGAEGRSDASNHGTSRFVLMSDRALPQVGGRLQ